MPNQTSNKKAYIALTLVCIIWGTTYLINKLGVTSMPPLFFTSIRQLVAGIILLSLLFLIKRESWPNHSFLLLQMLLGFLLITCGNGMGIYGLRYIDSGISAIISSFTPILIAFLLSISKSSPNISTKTWVGLILGSLGIMIICFQKIGTHPGKSSIIGILFSLAAILAWSVGSVVSNVKKHDHSPFLSAGFQMFFGGIPVFIISILTENPFSFHFDQNHFYIWAYTIILGSLIAYTCFIYCLNHLPVTLVSIHTYINPIIALFLGSLILDESLNIWIALGSIIALTGVYIVTKREQIK